MRRKPLWVLLSSSTVGRVSDFYNRMKRSPGMILPPVKVCFSRETRSSLRMRERVWYYESATVYVSLLKFIRTQKGSVLARYKTRMRLLYHANQGRRTKAEAENANVEVVTGTRSPLRKRRQRRS